MSWLRRLVSKPPASILHDTAAATDAPHNDDASARQSEHLKNTAREALRNNDFTSAAKQFQALVALQPGNISALTSLGYAQRQAGQIESAIASLTAAAALDARRGEPHYMLSEIHRDRQHSSAAIEQLQLAIGCDAEFWFAYPDLVTLLVEAGQHEAAIAACAAGMVALPQSDRLLLLRANLAIQQHDDETTVSCFRLVLELTPGNLDARLGLGLALQRLGQIEQGQAQFESCFAASADHAASRWAWTMGHLPACTGPLATQALDPLPFQDALSWFSKWSAAHDPDPASMLGKYLPFLLAYREENHRHILSRYGAVCAELAHRWQARLAIPIAAGTAGDQTPLKRLRIGLVSPFFSRHSVWHAILKGWIKSLDRERFELIAFHLSHVSDDQTSWARQHVDGFEENIGDAAGWARCIAERQCDVLIYGSIGMDELSSQLANLRLAPVQAVTWGHPETSGLPSLDYYISADLFEPPDAAEAYSEKLIRLPHLGVNYAADALATVAFDVTTLGLDPKRPILICPGTPFKYSPLHDQVLVDIARRVEGGQLVFFQSAFTSMARAFRQRIEAAFANAGLGGQRCCFVPWMNLSDFHGLLQASDVFVDTIGFSGFNTAIQAIECSLPLVTLEGRFLRGRLASGVLRRIGMSDLVVTDQEALVVLVARLAQDRPFNLATRERIATLRPVLFDDETPVRALEQFLTEAIAKQRNQAAKLA